MFTHLWVMLVQMMNIRYVEHKMSKAGIKIFIDFLMI